MAVRIPTTAFLSPSAGLTSFIETPREELARDIWREVAQLRGLQGDLPPWQIIKERPGDFAALPSQEPPAIRSREAIGAIWRDCG